MNRLFRGVSPLLVGLSLLVAASGCASRPNPSGLENVPEALPQPDEPPPGASPAVREMAAKVDAIVLKVQNHSPVAPEDLEQAVEAIEVAVAERNPARDKAAAQLAVLPSRVGVAPAPPPAPMGDKKVLENFPVHFQPDPDGCGPTCVQMSLHFKDKQDPGYAHLKTACGTRLIETDGFSCGMTWPSGLRDGFNEYGREAEVLQGEDLDSLRRLVNADRPPILLVRSGELMWHYIVVCGFRPGQLLIADPDDRGEYWDDREGRALERGKRWLNEKVLAASWDFEADYDGHGLGQAPAMVGSRFQRTAVAVSGQYDPVSGFILHQVEKLVKNGLLPAMEDGQTLRDMGRALKKLAQIVGEDTALGKALHLVGDLADAIGQGQRQIQAIVELARGPLEELRKQLKLPTSDPAAGLAAKLLESIVHFGGGKSDGPHDGDKKDGAKPAAPPDSNGKEPGGPADANNGKAEKSAKPADRPDATAEAAVGAELTDDKAPPDQAAKSVARGLQRRFNLTDAQTAKAEAATKKALSGLPTAPAAQRVRETTRAVEEAVPEVKGQAEKMQPELAATAAEVRNEVKKAKAEGVEGEGLREAAARAALTASGVVGAAEVGRVELALQDVAADDPDALGFAAVLAVWKDHPDTLPAPTRPPE